MADFLLGHMGDVDLGQLAYLCCEAKITTRPHSPINPRLDLALAL